MKAWYFSNTGRRLRHGDNRTIKAGITHKVDGPVILCEWGLHGSVNPINALRYARGTYVWRVEIGGDVVTGADKLAGTERTYLWGYDATDVLRKFAHLCALDVAHLWDCPPVVMEYLKTSREDLRAAARDAARAAAGAAARAAAWAAAGDGAQATAEAAAGEAARAPAWAAAWAEAGAAARDAARDAAGATTWAEAWAEAGEKQNRRLYRMLMSGRPF